MLLLLAQGSAGREKVERQLPFVVTCFGYQTPAGIWPGSGPEVRRDCVVVRVP